MVARTRQWRLMGVGMALAMVLAACGGDSALSDTSTSSTDAATTTMESTTTAAPTTTSTTTTLPPTTTTTEPSYPFETHEVEATELCAIGIGVGGSFNVREGPSTDYDVVGTLAYGETGIEATGVAAFDESGGEWKEIAFEGEPRWAAAMFLTPGTCTVGTPAAYCVADRPCGGGLNIRSGVSVDYTKLGEFAATEGDVQGTGVTALDAQDRVWTQVEWAGALGWVADWFLEPQPCSPINCKWIITPRSIGNRIRIGMTPSEAMATGHIEGPDHTPSCGRGDATGPYTADLFVGLYDDHDGADPVELVEVWTTSAQFATPEGLGVGSTRAEIIAALGQPVEEMVWPYTGWAMWYDDGPYGIRFRFLDQAGPVYSVTVGYGWAIRILWDC